MHKVLNCLITSCIPAHRIEVQGPADMLLSAYRNEDDKSLVIVGVQEAGPEKLSVSLPDSQGERQVFQTTPQLNCQLKGSSRIQDGTAEVQLNKDSIFTLVMAKSDGARK